MKIKTPKNKTASDFSTLLDAIAKVKQSEAHLLSTYWKVADEMYDQIGPIKQAPSEEQTEIIRSIITVIKNKFGITVYDFSTIVAMVQLVDRMPEEQRRGDQQFWAFITGMAKLVGKAIVREKINRAKPSGSPVEVERRKMVSMLSTENTQHDYCIRNKDMLDDESRKIVADVLASTASSARRAALMFAKNGEDIDHLRILQESLDLLRSGTLGRSPKTELLARSLMEAIESWIK